MDWLTFFSKLAWPSVAFFALLWFRKPLTEILNSIKRFKFRCLEIECDAPELLKDEYATKLESILKNHGSHSFKWLRKSGYLPLSDEQFENVIAIDESKFQKTTILLIGQDGDVIEKRPGVKLAQLANPAS
jgi:hypothetical protein